MAEQYKLIHPVKYYRDYLNHKIRPDGREFLEFRKTLVNVGQITNAAGSSVVKMGGTNVVCGIRAEIAKPRIDEPEQGFLLPHIEIAAVSSPKYRAGSLIEDGEIMSYNLDQMLTGAKCVDLKDLCIAKDKWVWCLYCDIVCLSHDGCILDAAATAAVSALKNLKLPKVEYDPEIDSISVDINDKKPIEIRSMPVSTSVMVFDDNTIIVDPTAEEESLASSVTTIGVVNSDLCFMYKPGGSPMDMETMNLCIDYALKREKSVVNSIEKALKAVNE